MPEKENIFEIGLVMAGAVSAGAYTAGVIDFLTTALEAWEMAKRNGEAVPGHSVKIRVIAGASAGGMTAALMAGNIRSDYSRKLREAWVERISLDALLKTDDLVTGKAQSLLNSTIIRDIANEFFGEGDRGEIKPYFSDELDVVLTLANLRGIPYNVGFNQDDTLNYEMLNHSDTFHVRLIDQHRLENSVGTGDQARLRHDLKNAAIATGAFPVGLAPVKVRKTYKYYNELLWKVTEPDPLKDCYVQKDVRIPPSWYTAVADPDAPFDFISVDGGMFNNEPFGLARNILAEGGRNPRGPAEADKAILMIDPFPNMPKFDVNNYKPEEDLFALVPQLLGALMDQGRFKLEDVYLAAKEDIYSRYMIIPKKSNSPYSIACGFIGGFSGFIAREFRQHDYELGRRNCQRFLERHFALEYDPSRSSGYDTFSGWISEPGIAARHIFEEGGKQYIPVIPLLGDAAKPIARPVLNQPEESRIRMEYRDAIHGRIKGLLKNMRDHQLDKRSLRIAAWLLEKWQSGKLADKAVNYVVKELAEGGVARRSQEL